LGLQPELLKVALPNHAGRRGEFIFSFVSQAWTLFPKEARFHGNHRTETASLKKAIPKNRSVRGWRRLARYGQLLVDGNILNGGSASGVERYLIKEVLATDD